MSRSALVATAAACLALTTAPTGAAAQLGAIEAFARRVSDLSFYFTTGAVSGGSGALEEDPFGVTAFGVELLFEVAEITRPLPDARVAVPTDSVRRVWREMRVVHTGTGVDTIYTYDIEPVPPPPPPRETVWLMEMGIGYGQFQGYGLDDPTLDLHVAVRDLPSVSLYASYEPWGNYFGLRTGFMRTQALQIVDAEGNTFSGTAEAFLFGGLTGYAFAFEDLWLFLESGYTIRSFPSVEWRSPPGGPATPSSVPRELDVSGWFFTVGIQFPFN